MITPPRRSQPVRYSKVTHAGTTTPYISFPTWFFGTAVRWLFLMLHVLILNPPLLTWSLLGFQLTSSSTTRDAAVRLMPSPPAFVLSRKTLNRPLGWLKALIMAALAREGVRPSSRKWWNSSDPFAPRPAGTQEEQRG